MPDDLCACCTSFGDGNATECCFSFLCTACLYHKLRTDQINDYEQDVCSSCTPGCCVDVCYYNMVSTASGAAAGVVAASAPQSQAAMAVSSVLGVVGAFASPAWTAHLSVEALRGSSLSTRVKEKYGLRTFYWCSPCVYYNLFTMKKSSAARYSRVETRTSQGDFSLDL